MIVLTTHDELRAMIAEAVAAAAPDIVLAAPDQILTAAQAADLLHVSPPTLRAWVRRGLVTCRYVGAEPRYLHSDLLAALKLPEVKRTATRNRKAA